ncbi:MAG TPA: hypothetical protein VLX92_35180 [Kofleriaceae bacterium]|nr:hypothetical protein [Kofleriaceae bacterium]
MVDYNAALKIAALRLTGDLPTMAEIDQVANAPDMATQQTVYNGLIQQYMSRPAFSNQIFYFWRDTMKQGETPLLDTAPALAAELSVNNGSYMNLFTQSSKTCVNYSDTTETFTDTDCTNGGPVSGVLTDPGVMTQFFSNFAFRRTRWIQEVWDCQAFPVEATAAPQEEGGAAPYLGVWPFKSIASPTNGGGRVDFLNVASVVCANCHETLNHIAPLLAHYDMNGQYQTNLAVPTPLDGAPLAMLSDYLPPGESTAWRYQVPAADIPSLGADMAADPSVASCGVARIWNWALGKTDIVDTLEVVPADVIQDQVAAFTASGFKLKDMIYAVYTSDDFVKF